MVLLRLMRFTAGAAATASAGSAATGSAGVSPGASAAAAGEWVSAISLSVMRGGRRTLATGSG
jgi:hypothetical protein